MAGRETGSAPEIPGADVSFVCGQKRIDLYGARAAHSPLVVLNTFGDEGAAVWNACREGGAPPCTLAAISHLDWNADLTPWESPALSRREPPFAGHADAYLALLVGQLLPRIRAELAAEPEWTALAGYSLAGLFALYAGSLWYPHFADFAAETPFVRVPDCVYLSLGDAEAASRNRTLATVQAQTERLASLYASLGIPTAFVLNRGNHFADAAGRMARAIRWLLCADVTRFKTV